jgi:fructose-1,6-bisphosphatase/inositol monophosphatase family enzyme
MNHQFSPEVYQSMLAVFDAKDIVALEDIQTLWSGYGKIVRIGIIEGSQKTAIVKLVSLPGEAEHPRGWNTDLSHQRKLKSYQVEKNWYHYWSHKCDPSCRVPQYYELSQLGSNNHQFNNLDNDTQTDANKEPFSLVMLMEDLDGSGFEVRKSSLTFEQSKICLRWLANFHATFLQSESLDECSTCLWSTGGYWHLATRPDELEALSDFSLQQNAVLIDERLEHCQFKTLIHGDAKVANFCFSLDGSDVAAVDFQYVGSGCGMKDLAYFVGSCFDEDACESLEQDILQFYFSELKSALVRKSDERGFDFKRDFELVEKEWRELYPFAWADFHRFIKGWSPGHWKINSYSERVTKSAIEQLENNANKKNIGSIDTPLSDQQLVELNRLAIDAVLKAAEVVAQFTDEIGANESVIRETKVAGDSQASQVVTQVDRACQKAILDVLEDSMQRFDLGLLTEELPDDGSRFNKGYFWCIDPLDGTLPFIENRAGYSISIALVSSDGQSKIGVVYDPVGKNLYSAVIGKGVTKNGESWCAGKSGQILHKENDTKEQVDSLLTICSDNSFKRGVRFNEIEKQLVSIAKELGFTGIKFDVSGGAVMNAIWCLENGQAIYFKQPKSADGGGCVWDFAATVLIFKELGNYASDYYGGAIDFNPKGSTFMNQKGICFATELRVPERLKRLN